MKIIFKVYYSILKLWYIWVYLGFIYMPVSAQSLCNDASAEKGDFEIDPGPVGCTPYAVKVKDKSGGTDIHYDFYYQNKTASELDYTNNRDSSETYFAGSFTILQYGKKNGKSMYACKKVTVRKDNQPKYTYTQCTSQLEISIPNSLENNFDYYKIDWGSANVEATVMPNQLPYSASKPVSYPTTIHIEGYYNTPVNGCSQPADLVVKALNASNFPNGLQPPFDPNIDKIENKGSGNLILTFKGSENPNGYNLQMREFSGNYPSNVFRTGVLPGENEISVPDSNKTYCFFVSRMAGCGSFEESSEVCSINLERPKIQNGEIDINWSPYPNNNRGYPIQAGVYSFNRKYFLEKKLDAKPIEDISLPLNTKNYKDNEFCFKTLNYRIRIEITGLLREYRYESVSYSNWGSLSADDIKPDALDKIFVSVNEDNKPEINIFESDSWAIASEKFWIYEMINNIPVLRDSLLQEGLFTMDSLDASQKSFCFKVKYRDECQHLSDLSNEVCTLHLDSKNSDLLIWEQSNPFIDISWDDIAIQSKDELSGIFTNLDKVKLAELEYKPDLKMFKNQAVFRLEALNDNSNQTSYSNLVELPLDLQLFIPNSYTPNGDGINDNFGLKGNIDKLKEFNIKIYNRWGEKVFESNNPDFGWSNLNERNELTRNIYEYKIEYLIEKNEKRKLSGIISVLK